MQCEDHKNPAATDASSVPKWFRTARNLLPRPDGEDRGEDMPWAMVIMLKVPKKEHPSRTALLRATTMTVVARCLDEYAGDDTSAYQQGLVSQYGTRTRKLTRRAHNIDWQHAQLAPGVTMEVDGAQARALVPTPVGETYPETIKLQISGTDLPYNGPESAFSDSSGNYGGADTSAPPVIWVDKGLNMSVEKVAAQTRHGSMLYTATLSAKDVWVRVQSGYALDVKEVPREQRPAPEPRAIEVQDAGFTEITPGSVTVAATPGAVAHD